MYQKNALIILLLMSGCGQREKIEQKQYNNTVVPQQKQAPRLDSSSFTVLPFSQKSDYLFPKSTFAELTVEEVQLVNDLLNKAVAEQNKAEEKDFQKMVKLFPEAAQHRENYFIDLTRYKRQFIAVLNAKGEKEVWANCFCNTSLNWRKEEVVVYDGGNCYFNVKINLTEATWYDMMVNGEA